ncbi:MAG: hypothetical protein ACFFKA_12685 [Candidatus Thorarchaeota archaeon]
MLYEIIDSFKEAWRFFQYDYIDFDAIFLSIRIGFLIERKQ